MSRTSRTYDKGVSLAKGPVGILGLAMIAWGVIHFLIGGGTSFSASPIDGTVTGDSFLGLEGNGWTNVLWAGGGLLLAFGAPMHWGAKSMALIVGLVLGAASVISMADGSDVFGIFATNGPTQLALGAVATALIILSLLPRVGGGRKARTRHHDDDDRLGYEDTGRINRRERVVEREPVEREGRFDREHDTHRRDRVR